MSHPWNKKKTPKSHDRDSSPPKAESPPTAHAGTKTAAIKSKIEELRKLEKQAFGPRHGKTDFYEYLKAIYNAWDWSDPDAAAEVAQQVAKLHDLKIRRGNSPIRTVIDATSKTEDRQERSRWTQAIEYAVVKEAPGKGFKKFLDRNGGVAGCATKMAELRREGKIGRKGKTGRKRDQDDDWD
jgi:hypothetical protein